MLRSHLLKPLKNIKKINFRLDCVSEFINNNYEFNLVRKTLLNVSDIETEKPKYKDDRLLFGTGLCVK